MSKEKEKRIVIKGGKVFSKKYKNNNYKEKYDKLLDDIIKDLHELKYSLDNRISAVFEESLENATNRYKLLRGY